MRTVLIFCDYFFPGYKAGGPITTLSSLISGIQHLTRVCVITTDRDYLDGQRYSEVDHYGWNDLGGYTARYLNRENTSLKVLSKIVAEVEPDTIYLNSVFSYSFSIRPLLGRRIGRIKVSRWVLCPRGELNEAALEKSTWRKLLFLTVAKWFGLYEGITWQATNEHEYARVKKVMGAHAIATQVENLSRLVDDDHVSRLMKKEPGRLEIIFVARINRHKNLLLLLEALADVDGDVGLRIYGPVDDQDYWRVCERKIAEIAGHVRVDYLGAHDRELIIAAMRWAHVLVLPSRSENFGQVIYEALSVGTPVILSDKTPWRGLIDKGVGWDCDIQSPEPIRQFLSEMILMNEINWIEMVSKSKKYARESLPRDQIVNKAMKLLFDI